MTLLGSGHLGDSAFKECTVIYCNEQRYKSAKAPRTREVFVLATLEQKKARFLLFHTKYVQVCDFAGLWAPGRLRCTTAVQLFASIPNVAHPWK